MPKIGHDGSLKVVRIGNRSAPERLISHGNGLAYTVSHDASS